ncbi:MAG: T9SS type A sorting domain-containing protein [Candidatus Latescibacteria bacterium]|nr:T9SS type A sorting domain-containing protein [Candidatus Latescibacterota bacterium]
MIRRYFRVYILACLHVAMPASAQIVHVWDLADVDQPGQLTIYNPSTDDAEFGTPVRAGDLNGDGFDDYVVSAMAGNGPRGDPRSNAGEVAVYFSPGTFAGAVDLARGPENVVTVFGEAANDIFGIKTEIADVDGDGVNDLLVGAFYADGPAGPDAGKLYLISGRLLTDLLATGADLDLGRIPWPEGVSVYHGPEIGSRLGVWMAAGDVDGDGAVDIVVGADEALAQRGQVFVLPGPQEMGQSVQLSDPPAGVVSVHGVDRRDHFGSCLVSADVDGDGYSDIVVGAGAYNTARNAYNRIGGAGDGPNNERPNAGEMYVVFGGPALPLELDLSAGLGDAMVMYGADGGGDSPDRLGEELVAADVNGDGTMDLLVGAYRADGPGNSRPDAGETYIVFGAASLRSRVIDMATPPDDVVVIYGSEAGAISGDALSAGDIHGDGYDDLFIGVPGDRGPLNRPGSGGIVVIAGGPTFPAAIDLAAPNVPVVWIQAPDRNDYAAYWAAAGDLDGDGHIDVLPNGMAGDGPFNERTNAGEAHAVSGAMIAQYLLPVTPTAVLNEGTTWAQLTLGVSYPNPFNSTVTIPFGLNSPGTVELAIYNLAGQRVATLVAAELAAGLHRARWDGLDGQGRRAASGVYLAKLNLGQSRQSAKVLLLR